MTSIMERAERQAWQSSTVADVEVRQLEAFVTVASELHFGRAAEKLYLAPPTLSELIRRLERELGTPLFTRTTRRVALTAAGAELLARTEPILEQLAAARAAVQRVAGGQAGTVRLGCTPPVTPTLAPHLIGHFAGEAPEVTVQVQRMWLPNLVDALSGGDIDVAITCGEVPDVVGIATEVFCAEVLLVGLRPDHRFAQLDTVALADLARDVFGATSPALFPAWALSQKQALSAAEIDPPTVELEDTDLAAARWADQSKVDWILLISSLAASHQGTVVRPVAPLQLVPFVLKWNPDRAQTPAVARFVTTALSVEPPPGWHTQPGHLHHSST
jgi:DNA-binding transcriptional LysR family regulator